VFQLRSSGRILGDSPEQPNVIEELDVGTGEVREIADLTGIVDLSVSDDGKWLAVAHSSPDAQQPGMFLNSVTRVDLETGAVSEPMPRAPDVPAELFSSVNQMALSPDGRFLAYALTVEVELYRNVITLRIRDLETDADSILYTAEGSDSISDLAWSADGATVVAAVTYRLTGDTLEAPLRFRTLRIAAEDGHVSTADGFAGGLSPIDREGSRLLGAESVWPPPESGSRSYEFVAWDETSHVTGELPFDGATSGPSIASCSYS
jgi:hypothetical protein